MDIYPSHPPIIIPVEGEAGNGPHQYFFDFQNIILLFCKNIITLFNHVLVESWVAYLSVLAGWFHYPSLD